MIEQTAHIGIKSSVSLSFSRNPQSTPQQEVNQIDTTLNFVGYEVIVAHLYVSQRHRRDVCLCRRLRHRIYNTFSVRNGLANCNRRTRSISSTLWRSWKAFSTISHPKRRRDVWTLKSHAFCCCQKHITWETCGAKCSQLWRWRRFRINLCSQQPKHVLVLCSPTTAI